MTNTTPASLDSSASLVPVKVTDYGHVFTLFF